MTITYEVTFYRSVLIDASIETFVEARYKTLTKAMYDNASGMSLTNVIVSCVGIQPLLSQGSTDAEANIIIIIILSKMCFLIKVFRKVQIILF